MSEGQKGNGKAVTTATDKNAKLYKPLCFNKTSKRNAALGLTFAGCGKSKQKHAFLASPEIDLMFSFSLGQTFNYCFQ